MLFGTAASAGDVLPVFFAFGFGVVFREGIRSEGRDEAFCVQGVREDMVEMQKSKRVYSSG